MSSKEGCATFCMIMAAWAVPILVFCGYLCAQGSHMIELPQDQKKDAAFGCFGGAALYAVTFLLALQYKNKLAKAPGRPVIATEMASVTEGRDRRD
mmetsp:Transcript_72776/g.190805  ORF Transcript_72776/g.190805 Transcript_72776/m.190805 type:complete len:96 (-) Transcript_72776:84-371(-)